MDWLGKMIALPPAFLHSTKGSLGGGVIQVSMKLHMGKPFQSPHYCSVNIPVLSGPLLTPFQDLQ